MEWETVIGLETHVELATQSKLFCSCATRFGGAPNTQCCPVCLGMPGALPVLNALALEYALKAGLALNCTITRHTRFDRKNYFYPDLPKAYQISQLYLPLCRDGRVTISTAAGEKTVRIHELHLEEDAGKLLHDHQAGLTKIDHNRCGVPLIEIVTEPDLRTGEEAVAYLETLRSILRYLGVSDCKMQEGSLRCDVNLSVRPSGSASLGVRTEMKNLGSFSAVARAIRYEAQRQISLWEGGSQVVQETRRWDEDKNVSFPLRAKENARDYRYFPEPDLPPVHLSDGDLARLRAAQPELAGAKRARYMARWGLPEYDADMLTGDPALAAYVEECVALGADPKQAANWILGECLRRLSADGLEPKQLPLSPAALVRLISLVQAGRLNRNTAVQVFDAVFANGGDVDAYVAAHRLEQISDPAQIGAAAKAVLAAHPKSVQDYRAGKEKAFGFLVGQTMRALKGRADPQLIHTALHELLRSP